MRFQRIVVSAAVSLLVAVAPAAAVDSEIELHSKGFVLNGTR